MKLAFACPFYGPTYPLVGFGQRANIMEATKAGHAWVNDYSSNGMQHREACERMVARAVEEQGLDAVFWTEHDVVLPPDAVVKLAQAMQDTGADIVTGFVFRRSAPYSPMVSKLEHVSREKHDQMRNAKSAKVRELANAWTFEEFDERFCTAVSKIDPREEPYEVDMASMGCLLIKRSALDSVKDVPDLFAAEPLFSIDNVFLMHTRRAGLKLYAVPAVLCGHLADPEIITWQHWQKAVSEIVAKCIESQAVPSDFGTLTLLANRHRSDKGTHGHSFTDFYESYLGPIRDRVMNVLEIGVWKGASVRTWADYFPNALVHGIDIDTSQVEGELPEQVRLHQADQANREQLWDATDGQTFDLIVDDGGHTMEQQQVTLAALFGCLRPGGIYILEDVHTSLMGAPFSVLPDSSNSTLKMLQTFIDTGRFESRYMTADEVRLLDASVSECRIFKGRSALSLTCVMRCREA
jgi:hypothetical protein